MAKKDKGEEKTNVMRLLDASLIPYTPRFYDPELTSGTDVAAALGQSAECLFKTLVTVSGSGEHFVFVIPSDSSLDLKKAARAAGEKSVAMIRQKDLLPLTGYVHGGCSPVGMKKPFPTFVHLSAEGEEQIFVSAGKVGFQVGVNPKDLSALVRFAYADLVTDT